MPAPDDPQVGGAPPVRPTDPSGPLWTKDPGRTPGPGRMATGPGQGRGWPGPTGAVRGRAPPRHPLGSSGRTDPRSPS
ncbi:hypothetical protein [Ornithinimicrobium kibberense]|uniref:hypothetical protein n=1 Tax=Ornithinimicrobium kibberense TaxID=282060 RepID=UPI00360FCACC